MLKAYVEIHSPEEKPELSRIRLVAIRSDEIFKLLGRPLPYSRITS